MASAVRAVSCPGCATLEARLVALERAVERLQATPRDREDLALRRQLAESTRGHWFQVAELLRHATDSRVDDQALRQALRDADVETAEDLGLWLRRGKGTQAGIAIVRQRRAWRVVAL